LREGEDRDERAAGAQEGGEFDSEPQVDLEPDHVVGLNLPGQPPAGPAPPLWTRDFIFLVAGNLALFMSFYLLLPTLPVYVVEMGGGETAAGLIVGLFSVSAVLIRPAVGWGLDVLGRRLLITIGLAVFAVNAFAYEWVGVVLLLLGLRALHGLSWGVATTGMGAAAADLIPKRRLGEGMGYFSMAATVSMGVAPAVGLAIIGGGSFTSLFALSAALGALAFLSTRLVTYPKVERGGERRGILSMLVAREAVRPAVTAFFATMTYGAILAFVALHAADQGVGNVGLFFTVYAVFLTVIRPPAGRLADRIGFGRVIVPALVFMGAAMVVLSVADRLSLFLLAAVLYGIGFGIVHPMLQALAVLNIAPDRRGAANATFFSAFDLGITGGSSVGGLIVGAVGYGPAFLYYTAPIGAALLAFLLLRDPGTGKTSAVRA